MSNDSRSSNGGQGGTATPGNMEELFNDSISSLYSQFSNQSGTERQVLRTSSLNIPRTVTTTESEQRGGDDPMDEQQGGNSRQRRRRRNSAPMKPLSHGGSSSDARLVSPSSGGSNRNDETSSRSLPYESSVPILYLLDAIGRDALSGEQKRSSLRHMLIDALDTLDLDGDDGDDLLG